MARRRSSAGFWLALAVPILLAACGAGGAPSGPASTTGQPAGTTPSSNDAAATPITLRMADAEDRDRPSQPYIDRFLETVTELSGGSITVEVLYNAGGNEEEAEEQVVARRVLSGEVELALVPVRAWNDVGVTSLQALQTPFLIDNDALLTAVAKDPLVAPLLDGMREQGLVGISAWPESLRHIVTWERNGPPIVKADDLKGATMWALTSKLQTEVFETLGAKTTDVAHADPLVLDGTLRGAEASYVAAGTIGFLPTATSDLVVYPKYQILAAEDAAWSRLTPLQQEIITKAATAARDYAISSRSFDWQDAIDYCASGGRTVLAGPDGVATFVAAVRPMVDRLSQDPLTATAITTIERLKATTPAEQAAGACEPPIDANATHAPVPKGPPTALIPDGVYTHERSTTELLAAGVKAVDAGNNSGKWTLRVTGESGSWTVDHSNGQSQEVCTVRFELREDRVRMNHVDGCTDWYEMRWSLDGDTLTLDVIDSTNHTIYDQVSTQAIFGGTWTKVE